MKGDFSRVRYAPYDNFNGILPQQGKVLLDSDGIAQTLIENNWHQTAARDILGRVAAVPAAAPDSFKIIAASLSGGVATLMVGTGHVWADGLLVRLESLAGDTVSRTATWLEPPLVPNEGSPVDVADGTTDVVVLEVWQRAVNGFEIPDTLIEPALGGPDTAERLQTAFAFRLARIREGESCASLGYDESGRGALTASLVPPVVTSGDCPVEGSGGYSGFEHQLYRIEIADTNGGASQFKWSRTNGGLVGRGSFDPVTQKIAITANLPAITSANQTSFYLEIEAYDTDLGYSRVIAGAQATLSGSTLQCTAAANFGAYPAAAGPMFFRLWDGISPISSYPLSATPVQLESGILLQFDADGAGRYFPGDYWMFAVRAQGIANPQTLVHAKKPEGINYYRVPLAEITWNNSVNGEFSAGTIEDCRTIVPPLTQVKGCCTCRVGDGVNSFGDFKKIQDAIDSLPAEGGEVCILPGRYFENVQIINRRDIVIHGCGWQTRVASASLDSAGQIIEVRKPADQTGAINPIGAVFAIIASQHIDLRSFAVEAADDEAGILIDGTGTSLSTDQNAGLSRVAKLEQGDIDITVEEMVLTAATLPAILAERARLLRIDRNRVAMKNVSSLWPAIYTSGTEIHIERNWVGIQSLATLREWLPITVVDDLRNDANSAAATSTDELAGSTGFSANAGPVVTHPGGIQIGGPSTDVYVLENEIEGGSRNGITLGSLDLLDANGDDTGTWTGVTITGEGDDCCTGTLQTSGTTTGTNGGKYVAGGLLTNIQIHRNRIRNMGLCGIGPVGFFDLLEELEVITVIGLNISHNAITRTVLRNLAAVNEASATSLGYGAICVADVQNLIVRDNTLTDFGASPGAAVCGVFVLHGEMIEISRNHIVETRDWASIAKHAQASTGGTRGGIYILLGTPPSFSQPQNDGLWGQAELYQQPASNALTAPIYEPGLPAVRVEHNTVRVPLGYTLAVVGYGPMSFINNHLGCGGLVSGAGKPLAQTVLILNLGTAIDSVNPSSLPSGVYSGAQLSNNEAGAPSFNGVSSGAVMFSNNVCQLETRVSLQAESSSVFIFTADHLTFSSNHCWLDAPRSSALVDALLVAGSLNVTGNRFQEAANAVVFSGLTSGKVNITGQNISTYCLIAFGSLLSNNNNLVLTQGSSSELCARYAKDLASTTGQ